MDNERFFEKFELIADLPDAVSRMRELVLELAVQGRLVEQDPNEESVDVLLRDLEKKFATETRKTVASEPPQIKRPFEIPETWAWAPLNSVGSISGGHTPSTNIPGYWNGSINWFTSKDIKKPDLYESELKITEEAVKRTGLNVYPAGSIVVVGRSGILKRTLPVAIIRKPSTVNQDLKVIQPIFVGMEKYIQVMLRGMTGYILKHLVKTGTTVQSLKYDEFFDFPFPLPPLSEQRRIVSKVEELMGICDALEAQQQDREGRKVRLVTGSLKRFSETPSVENLGYLFHGSYSVSPSDLRKTILTLAVQGKLVPQDPAEGNSLVGTHFTFLNGYAFKSEWFKSEGTRLCRNANIRHGTLDWKDVAFVDEKITNEFSRFSLSENDIVLSLDRPIINTGLKVARVRNQDTPCLLLQRVAKPVPKHDQIDLDYFFLWLNSPMFIDAIDPGRSNGVPHISTRQIEQIQICAPPLETQRRIVVKVEKLIAMVDEAEVLETQASNQGSSLLDAIVHEIVATAE